MGHDATICPDGGRGHRRCWKSTRSTWRSSICRCPQAQRLGRDRHIKTTVPETEVIISTGHGNMEEAIQALRRRRLDFLPKPCKLGKIAGVLKRVAEKQWPLTANLWRWNAV